MSININDLEKCLKEPKILDEASLRERDNACIIPSWWYEVVAAKERMPLVIKQWELVHSLMPNVYACIKEHCTAVEVVESNGGLGLVYMFQVDGRPQYWWGGLPVVDCQSVCSTRVSDAWKQLPDTVRTFHGFLHDGWSCIEFGAGLESLKRLEFLDEEEWGIVEDFDLTDLQLSDYLIMYTNGNGVYVCLNTKEVRNEKNALVWYNDLRPYLGHNLWEIIDSKVAGRILD